MDWLGFPRYYLKKIISNSTNRNIFFNILFFILITGVLFSNLVGTQIALKPGQISPRDIRAPHTAIITDEARTKELQEQAAASVRKVYREDQDALDKARQQINGFYDQIETIRNDSALSNAEQRAQIKTYVSNLIKGKNLTGFDAGELARYLVSASDRDLDSMRDSTNSMVTNLMSQPITEEVLPETYKQITLRAAALSFNASARKTVELAATIGLKPNLIYDEGATQRAVNEAVSQVVPVQRTVKQGQVIVREGDPVTSQHLEILEQLGIQRTTSPWVTLGGSALMVGIFLILSYYYLWMFHRSVYRENRLLMLLGMLFLIVIVLAKVLTVIKVGDRPEINVLVGYLIPVAAGSMLVAILVNQEIAYFFTVFSAIFVGLLTQGNQIAYAITAFVSGVVGVFWVSRLHQAGDLAKSSIYLAVANIATIMTMFLIYDSFKPSLAFTGIIFGAINGFVSAILTIGLLPYIESVFSVTSTIKLLELSNPNQPALRRLLVEAPGTYHHSVMVGNLAESAAEKIGANQLIVRVGAYYHDIGKLKRPYFFVENQLSSENPHEKIAPSLSTLIITSHIKDGVELAKETRLPRVVADFIEQHHGTSLVKYFYNRALEENKAGNVNEETFRYEGPKPQSKEVALVMLADSVEAAVRSLQDPTPGKIEGTVRRVIKDKLNDGQLEECDLTFRDLDIIAESFSKVLTGIYHNRVEYPETLMRELEKGRGKVEDINS